MVSIDYCILTMEIMEIYHKFSSDNDSQLYTKIIRKLDVSERHECPRREY